VQSNNYSVLEQLYKTLTTWCLYLNSAFTHIYPYTCPHTYSITIIMKHDVHNNYYSLREFRFILLLGACDFCASNVDFRGYIQI
jgi:hypothetical protein